MFAEVSLAANQWIEDVDRMSFKREGAKTSTTKLGTNKLLSSTEITLNPMEIRTFIMSPPFEDSHGINLTVSKSFPFIILAMILKAFLKL